MATYTLHDPFVQPEDSSGNPLAGAKLYFYLVGTTTTFTVYQDAAGSTPHANPVIADASGIFAPIYVGRATYKTLLTDANDVTVQTVQTVTLNNSTYVADNNGSLVTAGTSSAYTITTGQGLGTAANGNRFSARIHTTNVAAATINVDGGGAVALKFETTAGDFTVGAGMLQAGGVYDFIYSSVETAYLVMNHSRGEVISSAVAVGSAVALTTDTAADVTSITLTPGIWDVFGFVAFSNAAGTSITRLAGSLSQVSATADVSTAFAYGSEIFAADVPGASGLDFTQSAGPLRISVANGASTTIYLVALATFTVSTLSAYGAIRAARA